MELTDEQRIKIIGGFIGLSNIDTDEHRIYEHGKVIISEAVDEYLLLPETCWAIIDKLTEDGTTEIRFRSYEPGFATACINSISGVDVTGSGTTSAKALIDALLKYLEGK
jgi:hypothetical protein